jgi:hypothetical protein
MAAASGQQGSHPTSRPETHRKSQRDSRQAPEVAADDRRGHGADDGKADCAADLLAALNILEAIPACSSDIPPTRMVVSACTPHLPHHEPHMGFDIVR